VCVSTADTFLSPTCFKWRDACSRICYFPCMDDVARRQRADARRSRAVLYKTRLSSQERDPAPLCGPDAISLVLHLTRESYSLGGLEEPAYTRDQIPCRFVPRRST
jgi:hypothetical protein